jgi:hypothetical protein
MSWYKADGVMNAMAHRLDGVESKKNSFCTCVDDKCPCNPVNCEEGCTPCIAKNLAENEIPVCFYRKMEPDMSRNQDYSFKGFAAFVKKHLGE